MDRYADALISRMPDAVVPDAWRMGGPRYLSRYWRYPRALRGTAGDLVHVLDHSYAHCLRAFRGRPSVVTVHDLLPLRTLAEGQRGPRSRVRDALLRGVLRWIERADRLIVSTQFTAHEVERYLGVPGERVKVIPYGVDPHFFVRPPDGTVAARRAEWLRRTGRTAEALVILHVGSCHPRKNVEAAISALGLVRARNVDAILVQVGGTFDGHQRHLVEAAQVRQQVLQEPAVSEKALVSAYAAADLLIMPSSFEGFGLPVVEAMAAGLPVINSGAGGLREVSADAALITASLAPEALADQILKLHADPALRAGLVAVGRLRAASLSWDAAARQTRALYAELLAA
jgi:glycosyltransferase involved in cell wall biosynthesis